LVLRRIDGAHNRAVSRSHPSPEINRLPDSTLVIRGSELAGLDMGVQDAFEFGKRPTIG